MRTHFPKRSPPIHRGLIDIVIFSDGPNFLDFQQRLQAMEGKLLPIGGIAIHHEVDGRTVRATDQGFLDLPQGMQARNLLGGNQQRVVGLLQDLSRAGVKIRWEVGDYHIRRSPKRFDRATDIIGSRGIRGEFISWHR